MDLKTTYKNNLKRKNVTTEPSSAPRITSHGLCTPILTLLCATKTARIKIRKEGRNASLRKVTATHIENATAA